MVVGTFSGLFIALSLGNRHGLAQVYPDVKVMANWLQVDCAVRDEYTSLLLNDYTNL